MVIWSFVDIPLGCFWGMWYRHCVRFLEHLVSARYSPTCSEASLSLGLVWKWKSFLPLVNWLFRLHVGVETYVSRTTTSPQLPATSHPNSRSSLPITMPEYAGFSTSLISQYDAATIPESFVRVVTTPTLRSLHLDNICDSPGLSQHPDKTFSDLHKKATTVIETYIPIYQKSQFWVCYECPPPSQDEDDEVRYYYFKLCYDGRYVLSWGVGEEEHWRGKTTFGLFDGGRDFEGKRIVEKRGLFYPSTPAQDAEGFEIKIFRAKARRREPVRYQTVNETTGGINEGCRSLDLTSIGKVRQGERPKLLYTYALLDAKDEPWITFRYNFETHEGRMLCPKFRGGKTLTESRCHSPDGRYFPQHGCRGHDYSKCRSAGTRRDARRSHRVLALDGLGAEHATAAAQHCHFGRDKHNAPSLLPAAPPALLEHVVRRTFIANQATSKRIRRRLDQAKSAQCAIFVHRLRQGSFLAKNDGIEETGVDCCQRSFAC